VTGLGIRESRKNGESKILPRLGDKARDGQPEACEIPLAIKQGERRPLEMLARTTRLLPG
jgi:hypothetical protein